MKYQTFRMITSLYENTKKFKESQQKITIFVGKLIECILPDLIESVPPSCHNSNTENSYEVLIVTLLGDVTDTIFKQLSTRENAGKMFDKLFKTMKSWPNIPFVPDIFELKLRAYENINGLMTHIAESKILQTMIKENSKNSEIVEHFFIAVTGILNSNDLKIENMTRERYNMMVAKFGDLRAKMVETLKLVVANFDKETLLELLRFNQNSNQILDALFDVCLDVPQPEIRKTLAQLIVDFVHAEFFAEDKHLNAEIKKNIDLCYSWMIKRIIKTYSSGIGFIRQGARTQFKAILEELFEQKRGIEHYHLFKRKIDIMFQHMDILGKTAFDTKRVEWKFKDEMKEGVSPQMTPLYFAEVTAKYNLYHELQKAEATAQKEGLLGEGGSDRNFVFRDLCFELLFSLFEYYSNKQLAEENISSGFTLQKLADLLPWSNEEASKDIKIKIESVLEAEGDDENTILQINKGENVREFGKAISTSSSTKVSWSQLREEVQNLSLKMFLKASGFECSVQIIENSIERYKSTIFDYKALSNAHKRLSKIYKLQYAFHEKLTQMRNEAEKKQILESRVMIMNPEYYVMKFCNPPTWLAFLENKTFIYRGEMMLRLTDFEEKVKVWFPKAKLLKPNETMNQTTSGFSRLEDMNIQLSKVEAVFKNITELEGKKVPPDILEYSLKNSTNVFFYMNKFERNRNKENPIASTFATNFLYKTDFELPGIVRWSEVTKEAEYESSPIQNTLAGLQVGVMELKYPACCITGYFVCRRRIWTLR